MMLEQAQQFGDRLYQVLSKIGKGLSSEKRLEILDLLTQGSKSVEQISQITGMSIPNTSRHLQVLRDSHLVSTQRQGNHIIYALSSFEIRHLVQQLITVGENQLFEMKMLQAQADAQPNIQTISLVDAQKMRNSIILDVRPEDEYQAGHVVSAVNIPLESLKERMSELPTGRPVIVYCRGRLCPYTNLATQMLNQNGFNAYSLHASYYEWTANME